MVVSRIGLRARPPSVIAHADSIALRADFLQLMARVGLSPDDAAMLVERTSGQPFDACEPAELLPVLDDLLALAQRTTRIGPGHVCEE